MCTLRTKGYLSKFDDVRKGLNFKGEMSDAEMEILFIRTAEKNFPKDNSLEKSIRRDIFLMAIGLLKGYRSGKNIEKRRIKFLQESKYVAIYKKGKYASCREDEITESIKEKMMIDLRKSEDRVIAEIANKLYDQKDCKEYSILISEYYECGHKHRARLSHSELPSLRHPGNCFFKNADSFGTSKETEVNGKIKRIKKKLKYYMQSLLTVLGAVGTFGLGPKDFINRIRQENTPAIEKIHVFNDPVVLQSGQSKEIEVAWYPNNADKDELKCGSDDPAIAAVDDLVVTAKEWKKGKDTTKVSIWSKEVGRVEVDIIVKQSDHDDKPERSKATRKISPDSGTGRAN